MKGCRALTEAEVALVQRGFGGAYAARDKALFLLGVKSGFRVSEPLSLRVADAPPHQQVADQVTVRRRHMKTRREGRTAPPHPDAKAALAARLLQLRRRRDVTPQTSVFQGRKGANRWSPTSAPAPSARTPRARPSRTASTKHSAATW